MESRTQTDETGKESRPVITQNEFAAFCAVRFVLPAVALESPEVVDAIRRRDRVGVLRALDECV